MKQICPRTPVFWLKMSLTVMFVAVGCMPAAWAEAELFPSTEVTARYDVWSWIKRSFTSAQDDLQVTLADASLALIEPAAGHGGGEEAKNNGHSPQASGKSEGEKSFTGKVIGAPPPLPKVTIGGQEIVTKAASVAAELSATTPEGLKSKAFQEMLARRYKITTYAHDPRYGNPRALITVVEFVDLSCGQCMPELAKIDAALQDISSSVLVTHVHAPMTRFQDTNMQAFYSKVAARGGVFWEYRANLIKDIPTDGNAIFNELAKSGMSIPTIRGLMLNEARRFYRELDADALLARSLGIGKPPVVFVNGIRLGEHGIPLEHLSDVLKFVQARIQQGLQEPPQ